MIAPGAAMGHPCLGCHDAGEKLGFLKATVEFALKNPTLGPPFARYLKDLYRNNGTRRA